MRADSTLKYIYRDQDVYATKGELTPPSASGVIPCLRSKNSMQQWISADPCCHRVLQIAVYPNTPTVFGLKVDNFHPADELARSALGLCHPDAWWSVLLNALSLRLSPLWDRRRTHCLQEPFAFGLLPTGTSDPETISIVYDSMLMSANKDCNSRSPVIRRRSPDLLPDCHHKPKPCHWPSKVDTTPRSEVLAHTPDNGASHPESH
eukprot:1373018-Amphidinium_carterae.1